MQATPRRKATSPTITEQARRAQIVAAAITTMSECGYPKASFAQIVKRAGLSSTGLISYHFASKRDLDQAIVADVIGRLGEHMYLALRESVDATAALHNYILGLIDFMRVEAPSMQALLGVFMNGGFDYTAESEQQATGGIADILQRGQAEGVFRDFDIAVMASTIQRSLDGIPLAQAANPDLDLGTFARELVDLFTRATRKDD